MKGRPTVRRAGLKMKGARNLSAAPPASNASGRRSRLTESGGLLYKSDCNQIAMFSATSEFRGACKIFSSSGHTSAGRGKATGYDSVSRAITLIGKSDQAPPAG